MSNESRPSAFTFRKAVKHQAKGRVALVGPAGSGKSYTMLVLARLLAGPDGTIAAIDTEHGSLSKYAHTDTCGGQGVCADASHFDFDVLELSSFTPSNFMAALKAAEQAGYSVFSCDSLSHFWVGKDGALEFVDIAAKRNKDKMGGWKDFRPHERAMVDAMVASPCHVIATMRTKTEYQDVTGDDGKKKRVKIGLAPVQREGLEYEFDLIGYMDSEDNSFKTDKTRCPQLSGKYCDRPGPEFFVPFVAWLGSGSVREATKAHPNPAPAQEPPSTPPSSENGDDGSISKASWESMKECAARVGWKPEELKEWLKGKEISSRSAILNKNYRGLILEIEGGGSEPAPEMKAE